MHIIQLLKISKIVILKNQKGNKKKKKKDYITPKMEITEFENEDVIQASGNTLEEDEGGI